MAALALTTVGFVAERRTLPAVARRRERRLALVPEVLPPEPEPGWPAPAFVAAAGYESPEPAWRGLLVDVYG